ncbi:hypothetical protein E2562_008732 [Oryza meyeriana var. granulata]|uniref:Uncharacterized protein n=1 Tax=Oryza meyeriana var. granulata TaxID=110450 RepID=A0A6G1F5L0_9ORYZ|nr:hypothetical protein E2562_008732 [Oryza meyeriana var. granulata]
MISCPHPHHPDALLPLASLAAGAGAGDFLYSSTAPAPPPHRPGIPKTPARSSRSKQAGGKHSAAPPPLPLPPSLLSRASDPYASAVVPAEYAGAMPPPPSDYYMGKGARRSGGRLRLRRRPRLAVDALAEWLSVLSLYRSCKRAAACFAAKAKPPPAP